MAGSRADNVEHLRINMLGPRNWSTNCLIAVLLAEELAKFLKRISIEKACWYRLPLVNSIAALNVCMHYIYYGENVYNVYILKFN